MEVEIIRHLNMMQPNMLMMSWVAGALPASRYQALLCSAGSGGYTALRQSLGSPHYPQHTILLTNVDIREVPSDKSDPLSAADVGEPYSLVTRVDGDHDDYVGMHAMHHMLNSPLYYYASTDHILYEPVSSFGETGRIIHVANPRTHVAPISNVGALPVGFLQCRGIKSVDLTGMRCLQNLPERFLSSLPNLETLVCGEMPFTKLPDRMLNHCPALTSVDFTNMENATELPQYFLANCGNLTDVNFAGLGNVTTIHLGALERCHSLSSIDFAALSKVSSLPPGFMSGHIGLKSVDFAGFENVTTLSPDLLRGCIALESVNLSPLINVTEIQSGFLGGCTSLVDVDFSGMCSVRTLPSNKPTAWGDFVEAQKKPYHFLSDMAGLKSVNFAGFENVTILPEGLLSGCTALEFVNLAPLKNVDFLPDRLLKDCISLKSVDFNGMENARRIKSSFLVGCSGLVNINVSGLGNVTIIEGDFLSGCTSLVDIDFSGMCSVSKLPANFLAGLTSLKSVNFAGFENVTILPEGLLSGCSALESVNLSPFKNVTKVCHNLLNKCHSLKSVDMTGMDNTTELPRDLLVGCSSLIYFNMGGLSNVTSLFTFAPLSFSSATSTNNIVTPSKTTQTVPPIGGFGADPTDTNTTTHTFPLRQREGHTQFSSGVSNRSRTKNYSSAVRKILHPLNHLSDVDDHEDPATSTVGVPLSVEVTGDPTSSALHITPILGSFGQAPTISSGPIDNNEVPPSSFTPGTFKFTGFSTLSETNTAHTAPGGFGAPTNTAIALAVAGVPTNTAQTAGFAFANPNSFGASNKNRAVQNPQTSIPSSAPQFLQSCTSLTHIHNVPPKIDPPPEGWVKDTETSWKHISN